VPILDHVGRPRKRIVASSVTLMISGSHYAAAGHVPVRVHGAGRRKAVGLGSAGGLKDPRKRGIGEPSCV
jgi:hypothetical protein